MTARRLRHPRVWYRYKQASRPKDSASLADAAIFVEADRMAVETEIRA